MGCIWISSTRRFSFTMQIVCYISISPLLTGTFWCARFPQTSKALVTYLYKKFNYYWPEKLCPRTFVCARFPTHLVNDLIITVYLYGLVNVQPRSDKITSTFDWCWFQAVDWLVHSWATVYKQWRHLSISNLFPYGIFHMSRENQCPAKEETTDFII